MDVEVQDELKRLRLELSLFKNQVYSYGGGDTKPKGARPFTVFFDTTINKPLWWSGTAWYDASGTLVI